jgi:hypothetical protein
MLSDWELMQPENFACDISELCCLPPDFDVIETFLHTLSYCSAFRRLHIAKNDVIFPIELFIDKSQVSENGHLHLELVMFTFTFFSQETKNHSKAW